MTTTTTKDKRITITVLGGCVADVTQMPQGYLYIVKDLDELNTLDDEETKLINKIINDSEKTIVITVEGGCVIDVENLPEGFSYSVNDLD